MSGGFQRPLQLLLALSSWRAQATCEAQE
jgi:hypothetical protein